MAADTPPPTEESTAATAASAASTTTTTNTNTTVRPGVAGRIDYDGWHKKTKALVQDTEDEEQAAKEANARALGHGKYASSQAEAEERRKSKDIKHAKKALEHYQKREAALHAGLKGLLGPPPSNDDNNDKRGRREEGKTTEVQTVRITRDMLEAGKRVVKVVDTAGQSLQDTLVLTSDLSLLESKMKANAMQPVKAFPDDAENTVPDDNDNDGNDDNNNDDDDDDDQIKGADRAIFGVIKAFISNVHNCTILIKCKIITGAVELSHCSNVTIRIEKDASVATIQADLCDNITVEFRDAPSGKNIPGVRNTKVYWGQDTEDRIFHAGVSNMMVKIIRDDYVETSRICDYLADGASTVGNASAKEFQFVTSVLDEELVTEAVVRAGSTTGENARAMTKRELEASNERRDKAAAMALNMADDMIKFKEVAGKGVPKVIKGTTEETPVETVEATETTEAIEEEEEEEEQTQAQAQEEEVVEEVFGSMTKEEIAVIVKECEKNKARGNEAFGTGEYAQAILLYTLALDKADELPDAQTPLPTPLFPRDVALSNRAACFLKMGNHEKAEEDALKATALNPSNVKAIFRRGLALHAMKDYEQALPILAQAHKLEPKNKQIKEALKFAEVRMTQEMRKRMEG